MKAFLFIAASFIYFISLVPPRTVKTGCARVAERRPGFACRTIDLFCCHEPRTLPFATSNKEGYFALETAGNGGFFVSVYPFRDHRSAALIFGIPRLIISTFVPAIRLFSGSGSISLAASFNHGNSAIALLQINDCCCLPIGVDCSRNRSNAERKMADGFERDELDQ
jgi:hypothetical protein